MNFYCRLKFPKEKLSLGLYKDTPLLILLDQKGITAFLGSKSLFFQCRRKGYFLERKS